MVLSACVGLLGGSAAAWAVYHRLGPAERVIDQPVVTGSGGGSTLGGIAADRAPSLVTILTRPVTAEGLAADPAGFVNGFVAGADGIVITSARALEGATRLRVALADGHGYDAIVAGIDAPHGLVAMRAVGAHDLPTLTFAARDPRPGDFGLVLCRPGLQGLRITTGTVSSAGRSLGEGAGAVTDAATMPVLGGPAEEGAPLLDDRGAVIGVATHPAQTAAGPAELVALSGRAAAGLVDRVARGAGGVRADLGIASTWLDPATAAAASLPPGALVRTVTPGSPAAEAGIARGDIVTAVDGRAVDADHPLDPAALHLEPGRRVTLSLVSGGRQRDVALTVVAG